MEGNIVRIYGSMSPVDNVTNILSNISSRDVLFRVFALSWRYLREEYGRSDGYCMEE